MIEVVDGGTVKRVGVCFLEMVEPLERLVWWRCRDKADVLALDLKLGGKGK